MSGAEQLSQAIMESDAAIVRPNHDLQMQMSGRKERLSFLIKFINDNGVLTKVGLVLLADEWHTSTMFRYRCPSVAVSTLRPMPKSCMLHISSGCHTQGCFRTSYRNSSPYDI